MNKVKFPLFSVAFVLALAFTFSCSGDDSGDGDNGDSSSSGTTQGGGSSSSSSSDGGISSSDANTSGVFVDPRDGQKYAFEPDINGLIWMSGNLNYSRNNTLGYCYGVDINGENAHRDSTSCDNGYGRVYEWSVAMDNNTKQGLCPDGWHVPSEEEWYSLQSGEIIMSDMFCVSSKSGNYNTDSEHPPIDWKERNEIGFYWTSSDYTKFAIFEYCWTYYLPNTDIPHTRIDVDIGLRTMDNDYFSIRCVADND